MLGISSQSLIHHSINASPGGQIPGYATHLEGVAKASKYVNYGGWLCIAIDGGASAMKVQKVCVAGSIDACERVRLTELGSFSGGVAGGRGGGLMVRGKVKLLAKKCKHCSVTNEVNMARIKGGLCYTCRKSLHDARGVNMLKQASVRLKVLLSVISLCCLLLAGYSIYYNHIVLPYGGGRVRSRLLAFNGLGVAVPALALIMFAVGLLTVVAANLYRYSNEKACERIIRRSLCFGLFLYWISIFFADDIDYR
jgi:hypothetical protein